MERPRHTDEFWDWLVKRPVTDTPRGTFIEDTLTLIRAGNDPRDCLHRLQVNPKAEAVLKRLERLYKNSEE